jgi:hypothetical protein
MMPCSRKPRDDALLAQTARKSHADSLLTLNPKDFLRLWKDGDPQVIEP